MRTPPRGAPRAAPRDGCPRNGRWAARPRVPSQTRPALRRGNGPCVAPSFPAKCPRGASADQQRLHRRRHPAAVGAARSGGVGPLHDLPHLPGAGPLAQLGGRLVHGRPRDRGQLVVGELLRQLRAPAPHPRPAPGAASSCRPAPANASADSARFFASLAITLSTSSSDSSRASRARDLGVADGGQRHPQRRLDQLVAGLHRRGQVGAQPILQLAHKAERYPRVREHMGSARARRGRHGGGGHRLRGGHRAPPLDVAAGHAAGAAPVGARPIKVLHVSDLHITPGQRSKQRLGRGAWPNSSRTSSSTPATTSPTRAPSPPRWPRSARCCDPRALRLRQQRLLRPDVQEPRPLPVEEREAQPRRPAAVARPARRPVERGWLDATHDRHTLTAGGLTVAAAGVDDPHIRLDRYDRIAGRRTRLPRPAPRPHPLPRAARARRVRRRRLRPRARRPHPRRTAPPARLRRDRHQLRHRPLPRPGASRWGAHMWLHVSAGLGTAPDAPVRFACPPEASLLTLVPRPPARPRRRPPPQRRWRTSARLSGIGVWRSLVARFVRDEEVAGSNPVTPTIKRPGQEHKSSAPDQAVLILSALLSILSGSRTQAWRLTSGFKLPPRTR